MVGINETLLATAEAPFGGIKESGFGREGGSLGILDYMVPKYIRHHLAKGSGCLKFQRGSQWIDQLWRSRVC